MSKEEAMAAYVDEMKLVSVLTQVLQKKTFLKIPLKIMAFKQLTIMINHNQSWLWLISIIMINRDNSGLFFCVNQPVYQLCIRANIVNGRLINALKCNNILKNFAIFLYIQTYRSWRVCPWQRRWRSSCSSSVRSTRWWKRRRRRSHRYQTWVQVKFYQLMEIF